MKKRTIPDEANAPKINLNITCKILPGCATPRIATIEVDPVTEGQNTYHFQPEKPSQRFSLLGTGARCTHQSFMLLLALLYRPDGLSFDNLMRLRAWQGINSSNAASARFSKMTTDGHLLISDGGIVRPRRNVTLGSAQTQDRSIHETWLYADSPLWPLPPQDTSQIEPSHPLPVLKDSACVRPADTQAKEALIAASQWIARAHAFRWSEDTAHRLHVAPFLKQALHYVLRERFPDVTSTVDGEVVRDALGAVRPVGVGAEMHDALVANIAIELALLKRYEFDFASEYTLMRIAEPFVRGLLSAGNYCYWIAMRWLEVFASTCAYCCKILDIPPDLLHPSPGRVISDMMTVCSRHGLEPPGQVEWRATQTEAACAAAKGDHHTVHAAMERLERASGNDHVRRVRFVQMQIIFAAADKRESILRDSGLSREELESSNLFWGGLVRCALAEPLPTNWNDLMHAASQGRMPQ